MVRINNEFSQGRRVKRNPKYDEERGYTSKDNRGYKAHQAGGEAGFKGTDFIGGNDKHAIDGGYPPFHIRRGQ